MIRPNFSQNTFTMNWNDPEPGQGVQVVLDVEDNAAPFQTKTAQFIDGHVKVMQSDGGFLAYGRVLDYESKLADDVLTIIITDCGGGQSGIACLAGNDHGVITISDDDLQDQGLFQAGVHGCDDLYTDGGANLLSPDLSKLQELYAPAYMVPVHDVGVSGVGTLAFQRNVDFGVDNGKILWDAALLSRTLPVSTDEYWTAFVIAAWQAEETEDADPNNEDETGGVTKGISTHHKSAQSFLGAAYTGICAVFKAVFGEVSYTQRESYTVAHEMGHGFGLEHSEGGLMCAVGDCQTEPFSEPSRKKLRKYQHP